MLDNLPSPFCYIFNQTTMASQQQSTIAFPGLGDLHAAPNEQLSGAIGELPWGQVVGYADDTREWRRRRRS